MSEHYCTVHHTKFFKTANMKSYAHPVKDAGYWIPLDLWHTMLYGGE